MALPLASDRMALTASTMLLLAACWVRGRVLRPARARVRRRRARAGSTRARFTGFIDLQRPRRRDAHRPDRDARATRSPVGHHRRAASRAIGACCAGARAVALRGDRAARRPRASRARSSRRCWPTRATTAWWTAPTSASGRLPERPRHRRDVARARLRAGGAAARAAARRGAGHGVRHRDRLLRRSRSAGTSRATWWAASCSPPAGRWSSLAGAPRRQRALARARRPYARRPRRSSRPSTALATLGIAALAGWSWPRRWRSSASTLILDAPADVGGLRRASTPRSWRSAASDRPRGRRPARRRDRR